MTSNEEYREIIHEIVDSIEDTLHLRQIYTIARQIYKREKADAEGTPSSQQNVCNMRKKQHVSRRTDMLIIIRKVLEEASCQDISKIYWLMLGMGLITEEKSNKK